MTRKYNRAFTLGIMVNRHSALLALSLVLTGCAIPLRDEERRAIQSVSVSTAVRWGTGAPHVTEGKPAPVLLFPILGPIGLAIDVASAASAPSPRVPVPISLSAHLAENKIDIRELIQEEFTAELVRTKAFPLVTRKEEAQAHFLLTIWIWELVPVEKSKQDSELQFRPRLRVYALLRAADGKKLWEAGTSVNWHREPWEKPDDKKDLLPAYPLSEYFANPSLTREAFGMAAKFVASDLVSELMPR